MINAKRYGIYMGVVKDNSDPQLMGRLSVWIPEFGGNESEPSNWFIVSAASPFAGATNPDNLRRDSGAMDDSQQSYGFWMVPPDKENQVLICFLDGDPARGYWFACLWQQNMNHMVPGIPVGQSTDPSLSENGILPPVVEYNKRSNEAPRNPRRPVFEPLHEGLTQQGLYSDAQRGPSTSGARRESPSKVFGFSSPRQNAFVIDDNEENEFIRIRTRTGAQILIHETSGYIYANSKNGNSWIQISDSGVDVYTRGTMNIRSEGSTNIHSDGSLNMEADGNMNFRAGGNMTFQSAHHINVAANGNLVQQVGGTASTKAGSNILLGADGHLRVSAGGDVSAKAGGNHVRTGSQIHDNSSMSAPDAAPPTASVAPTRSVGDVNADGESTTRSSIVREMPTHEPYAPHVNSGDGPKLLTIDEFASPEDSESTPRQDIVPPGGEAADLRDINVTELDWLTACIIDEAGNQQADGQAAVAQVIKNRMATKAHKSDGSIKGTVLAKDQFSGFYHDTVNGRYQRVCSDRSCAESRGIKKIQKYKTNTAKWEKARQIGEQVMAGTYKGGANFNTLKANKRATMYLNYSATQKLNPNGSWKKWAVDSKRVAKIGDHTFYYA